MGELSITANDHNAAGSPTRSQFVWLACYYTEVLVPPATTRRFALKQSAHYLSKVADRTPPSGREPDLPTSIR